MAAAPEGPVSADSVLPGLIDEITEQLNRGQSVDVEAYVERHPELAAPLRRVCQTLSMLREPLPASASAGLAASDVPVPGRLGDFRIVREIGRGGMGIVYEAEQISLGRQVALKVLPLAGLLDKKQLSRFRNEARAAATLHHPHIVPVYAVGEDCGVHFYAMQLVEGKSLAEVIAALRQSRDKSQETRAGAESVDSSQLLVVRSSHATDGGQLTTDESATDDRQMTTDRPDSAFRTPHSAFETQSLAALSTARSTRPAEYFRSVARIGAKVADALHYAHEMGVVHRDVKPSNLLLDGDGQVWVTDFGLASVDGNSPGLTMSGDLVGTLRYMSPEQAGGRRELTDHRTDVYSLGVTLYELVTLRPAYGAADAEEDRGRLLHQILYASPRPARQIDRHIPRDLETIILKSIDKQRSARYETAGELAYDLRRFLAQRPIQARRASRLRRTWQWARRNPVAAALGALAACLLLGFAIAGPIVAVRERRLNSDLELQQYVSNIGLAASELQLGRTQRAYDILSHYQDSGLRGFEWHLLRAQSGRHRTAVALRPGPPAWTTGGTIRDVAYSPDGSLLAAAHWSNNVKLWDVRRRRVVHPLKTPGKPRAVAFSSDGAFVAAGTELAELHIWDVRDGSLLQTEELHGFVPSSGGNPWRAVHGIDFAPDRACVAVVVGHGDSTQIEPPDGGGALVLWGLGTPTPDAHFQLDLHVPLATPASAVAFDGDGSRVFVGSSDGALVCFSATDGSVLFRTPAHDLPLRSVALSPDGAHVATASCDQTIKLFRSQDGSHVRTLFGHTKDVHDVAFSPDGRHFASASFDSSIRLWDAETGEQIAALWRHASPAWCVAFAPDGRTFASGALEGAVRIWDVAQASQQLTESVQLDADAWGLAFSPDGRLVATCSESGQVWIRDAATGETMSVFPPSELPGHSLAFSPDGRMLVRGGGDWEYGLKRPTAFETFATQGELTVWEMATGAEVARRTAHGAAVRAVLVSREADRVISAGLDGGVKSWDFPELRQSEEIRPPDSPIFSAALSPDERLLILGTQSGVELWRLDRGTWRNWRTRDEHTDWVPGIAFSPDGRLFASSSADGTAIIWSAERGEPLRRLTGHQTWVLTVAFSRDGKTLAAASQHDIKLYNVQTGSELLTLHGHTNWVEAVAFSPVEDLLVSTSADETARFWRTR